MFLRMRATVLLVLVLFANCTSIRPLTDPTLSQENLSEQLNVDDRIWVLKKDGKDYRNLLIDSIEETYLLGHNNEADILIIPYSSMERIEKYHVSTVKNWILFVGIPVILVTAAVIHLNNKGF